MLVWATFIAPFVVHRYTRPRIPRHAGPASHVMQGRNSMASFEIAAPVGNAGQGRNRTIDTRIFISSESPVRRELAEDRESVSAGAIEPPRPTEPIPNPAGRSRPSRAANSRYASGSVHRDRTRAEPRLHSPVESTAVHDRRIVPVTRRSRHAHLRTPVKRTRRWI